jgi:outer membrane protein insertion porin family
MFTFFYRFILISLFIIFGSYQILSQDSLSNYIFYIEKIEIEGNSKTKDHVLFENLPFTIGDSISENKIHKGIEILNNLEIFSNVKMQPRPGSSQGNLIIKLLVEERYWPHFRFKGGYNELEGWFLTPISLNLDNIVGFGNFISLDLTFGDRLNALNLNYLNSNIFDSDLDFILEGSGRNLNFVHYIDKKKWIVEVDQGGLFLGFRSRDDFIKHFIFGISMYSTTADTFGWRYKSDDRLYEFPDQIAMFTGENIRSANLKIQFNYDLRNNSRYPSNGWWVGGVLEFADKQLGSKYVFTRFNVDARKYHNVYQKFVTAVRLKYGYITHNAPFFEKFYLGGPNSLRGYNDRSLSPLGGGNQLFQAGAELRLPISTKNYPKHLLTGILFFDSGDNIQSRDMFKFDNIKSSYGFGFRINIPFLGIIRADYGIPTDGSDKKIQFSLGHIF